MLALISSAALLAVLLVGMGATTRSSQRSTACAAHVRTLSAALALYATDNRDYLPHPGWGSVPSGSDCWAYATRNGGRDPMLPAAIPDVVGKEEGSIAVREQRGFQRLSQLWPYVGSHATYRCPADDPRTPLEMKAYLLRSLKILSYAMNAYVGPFSLPDGRTYKISGFRGSDFAFQEIDEKDPFSFNDGGNQTEEGVCSRHLGGGYLGRFDGGAELVSYPDYFRLARQPVGPNRLRCGPAVQQVP